MECVIQKPIIVSPKITQFEICCDQLQVVLNPGIRAIRTSHITIRTTYEAALKTMITATEDPVMMQTNLDVLLRKIRFYLERDLFQLCVRSFNTLDDWTLCLKNAIFVQHGYESCLYPYNEGVVQFGYPSYHTDILTRQWIHRMLCEHETSLNNIIHTYFHTSTKLIPCIADELKPRHT